jgi:hypothetical protein
VGDDQLDNLDDVYEVGYGRPPREHQFKKGKSGNPKGRPKGTKGFATLVRENLAKTVQVKLDGKTQTVSIGEAILMRTRDAVSGGKRAAEQGLKLMERYGPVEPDEPETVWDYGVFTDEELVEFERLVCKGTGKMERFSELEHQRELQKGETR